jgi:hypothetical protein
MDMTQERAEEIIRALQPAAQDDQIRALAVQLRRMLADVRMLDALDRTYWNLRSLSAGQPVRDLAETFAEAESVLAAAGRFP